VDEVHVKLYLQIAQAGYIPATSELNKGILPNRTAPLQNLNSDWREFKASIAARSAPSSSIPQLSSPTVVPPLSPTPPVVLSPPSLAWVPSQPSPSLVCLEIPLNLKEASPLHPLSSSTTGAVLQPILLLYQGSLYLLLNLQLYLIESPGLHPDLEPPLQGSALCIEVMSP
jgi:hypothetical protein